jgi:hypothetical protein
MSTNIPPGRPGVPGPEGPQGPSGSPNPYGQYRNAPAPPPAPPQPRAAKGPNTGFGAALLASAAWAVVDLVAALAVGAPDAAQDAGRFLGAMLVPVLIAALGTWLVARTRQAGWRFWQLALLALPFFLVLRLLFVVGMMSQSGVVG